jgi:type I restriction enzyme S subunit
MSPFDAARYARLLEGLEIAECKLSDLERTWRMDAEFFQQRHLAIEAKLAATSGGTVADVASVADGNHFSISESFVEDGVPYYRGQDVVGHFFIEQANPNRITREAFEQSLMRRSHLKQGDVLLSIIGTVGETSLVKTKQEATCSCKLAILRPKDIEPGYLATYLSSAVGRALTERWKRGAVQTGLLLEDMDQLPVPRFGKVFERKIATVVADAYEAQSASVKAIGDAEISLLRALGLEFWQASEALSYVRDSGQVFTAERFDAEYFHPAKTEALAKLSALSDCTVGDLFKSVRDLWQPDDDNGPDVVRNYDLSEALSPFLDGSKEPSERTAIASTKKTIQAGDLVVSRLRSYLKEIALVQSGGDVPMVASTEYIVLRPKKASGLPVEALMIFLRSALPQVVFKWSQDGSNHPRFDEKELLRLPLPRVLIQQASGYVIAVRSVISKRECASKLLDAAKRAVEIAIEQDEKSALAYLKGQA